MRIYLASPYAHPDPDVRKARFESANKRAAELMQVGHIVFSPISHSHPISACIDGSACDHDFWLRQDRAFLEWADAVVVNTIAGWMESRGIAQEIEWAEEMGKPVHGIMSWIFTEEDHEQTNGTNTMDELPGDRMGRVVHCPKGGRIPVGYCLESCLNPCDEVKVWRQ